jgi:hypothetical protein
VTATFESLMWFDERLTAHGEYPLPAFWVEQARRLYEHPTANTLVARCGRGSVKSGFGSRIALNEVLAGDFDVPESEIHYWVDISENKPEALQRLRQYETWLGHLGIPCESRGDEIVLPSLRRGFIVRAFQVGKLSGFRSLGLRSDELAKCAANPDAADSAHEVLASATAMLVSHVRGRPKSLLLASPVGTLDEHAVRFARGETAEQITCFGETWTCNPAITREHTLSLETDPRIWAREYAAQPQAARLAAFPAELVERAFRVPPLFDRTGRQVLVLDPSSGKKDSWCWMRIVWIRERIEIPFGAVSGRRLETYLVPTPHGFPMQAQRYVDEPWRVQQPDGTWNEVEISRQRIIMLVEQIDGVEGRFYDQVGADQIVERVANLAKQHGISSVHSDQRESFALKSLFQQRGISFHEHTWTGGDTGLKTQIVTALRRKLAEGTIIFPQHDRLKKELLGFEEKITPAGSLTFGGSRGISDDYVACVLTAQAAEIEGGTYPNIRNEVSGR